MKMKLHSKIFLTITVLFMLVFSVSGQAFAQVTGRDIANEASKYEGRPAFRNSTTAVQDIYSRVGIQLPNTLDALRRQGTLVRRAEHLQPGDIIFFGHSSSNLTSAGVYIGNNQFILSWQPYGTIRVISLSSREALRYALFARRIVNVSDNIREQVIQEGLKYVGTPYEFNSSRSSTATFDCSDFVRRAYFDATGSWIPGNSRTQAAYVRQYGKITSNWRNLQRGDLMFFTNPEGTVNHVAIYMGGSQILHATRTRGVHVGTMTSYWNNCFFFGGNILD